MRLWAILPTVTITDDRAYLLGRLQSSFDEIMTFRSSRTARSLPAPPKRPDLILNLVSAKCPELLAAMDAWGEHFGAPVSPISEHAWRAEDKRTYLDSYADVSPPTQVASSIAEMEEIRAEFGGDIVVKDPLGHGGNSVERVRNAQDIPLAEALIENSWNGTRQLVVQPYLSGFSRGDKRILVQRMPDNSYKIIAHIYRRPPPGGWKSNIRRGGQTGTVDLSQADIDLANELAPRTGLDIVVLDIGEHEGRNYFIETNCTYGGIIDYDLDRGNRCVDHCANFLSHLARNGRA